MNHRITFPSVHSMGGTPLVAEVSAPTPALAMREVLEHCAREGIALEYLRLHDIQDLKGARLDGLKLSHCKLSSVNLSGASLTGARIEHTSFLKVVADSETKLDRAMLDAVQFDDCALNGMSMQDASCSGLRFEFTTARSLGAAGTAFHGVRQVRSDLSGWRMGMARLSWFEDAEGVIAASDMTENERAAVRTLAVTGSREAAESFLARLNEQSTN